jgi:hypothetical protein
MLNLVTTATADEIHKHILHVTGKKGKGTKMRYKTKLTLIGFQPEGKNPDGTNKGRIYFTSPLSCTSNDWHDSKEEAYRAAQIHAFHVIATIFNAKASRIIYKDVHWLYKPNE